MGSFGLRITDGVRAIVSQRKFFVHNITAAVELQIAHFNQGVHTYILDDPGMGC